jgi:hypothetical protein
MELNRFTNTDVNKRMWATSYMALVDYLEAEA